MSQDAAALVRDGSQFTRMLLHPRIDGWIAYDSTVESQQFRPHEFFRG